MLKLLTILNTFLNGNLKDCLMKVLNFFPHLITVYKIRVKFNGSILRQPKVSFTHEKTVNYYIVYELAGYNSYFDDPTLKKTIYLVQLH